jgi:hypothetical protein
MESNIKAYIQIQRSEEKAGMKKMLALMKPHPGRKSHQ